MRRFLFVARVFPPQGGGGVQRPAKLARYLVDHGWAARVIAAPPSAERDESLFQQLPDEVEVLRLRAAFGTRLPAALRRVKLGRLYKRAASFGLLGDDGLVDLAETVSLGVRHGGDVEAVLATSLPFSSVVAGASIARALGRPFVADLRDPWAFAPRARAASKVHLAAMRALEEHTLARADAIATVTEGCREHLSPEVARRTFVIPNGFDPADLEAPPEPRSQDTLRLVHAGTLYGDRRPGPLLEALARAQAQRPDRTIELVVAGATHEHQAELGRAPVRVDLRGYLSHADAISLLRSADAIVALVGDQPADDHALPAKLFEAAALGPPVLCWSREESESARFVRATGAGRVVPDRAAIERAILDLAGGRLEVAPLSARSSALAPYDRRTIARRFAELLDSVAGPPSLP